MKWFSGRYKIRPAAARAMVESVDRLSVSLSEELAQPLKIGIGIHCGPAVVGRMGYGATVHVTAILYYDFFRLVDNQLSS